MIPSAQDKIILTGLSGSTSYGTAVADSDLDFMSFVIPPSLFRLNETGKVNEWGSSGTMESSDTLNGVHVEHKYFSIQKAIPMLVNFNPNIVPLLWILPEHYTFMSPEGKKLVENRTLFNSKKAYHTLSGFAHSQLANMGGVFNDKEEENKRLKAGYVRFNEWAENVIFTQREYRDAKDKLYPANSLEARILTEAYDEGFLNAVIELSKHSKERLRHIKDVPLTGRMGAKRKQLVEKFGYDVKYLCHTIRLMTMCVEFLKRPDEGLKIYRKDIDGDFLLSIREGKLSMEDGKKLADELFAEAKEALIHTDLPETPDYEKINSLISEII